MSTIRFNQLTTKCSCKGFNLDKLIQPQILCILAKKEQYGYTILQQLEMRQILNNEKIDKTGVYRTLKTLEEKGLIVGKWTTEDNGPNKKIYSITQEGMDCLQKWKETLIDYQQLVNNISNDIQQVLQEKNNDKKTD